MRLFVALDIPGPTRERLRDVIASLAPFCRGARWTQPENLHVTLKFIGHVDDAMLVSIQERLETVAPRNPIQVAFRNFGFFPAEKRPRVFWAGIEAGKELAALAGEIEMRLDPLQIPKEKRAFKPHLTLARFKTNEGVAQMHDKLLSLPADFGGATAEEFHLYQSVLKSSGAVYTKLASYRFSK